MAGASRLRSVTEVVPGRSLRFDDFVFAVRNEAETSDDDLGRTCVVTLEVDNRAKRVPYTFDPARTCMVDERGVRHRARWASPSGGKGLTASPRMVLPAGTEIQMALAFPVSGGQDPHALELSFGPQGDYTPHGRD